MSKRFIIVTVHQRSLILVFFPFSQQNELSLLPKKPICKQIVWNHDKTVRFFFKNVNDRFAEWLHFSNTLNLSVDTSNEEPHLLVFSITGKQSFPLSLILRPHFITLENFWLCSVLTTGYKRGTYVPADMVDDFLFPKHEHQTIFWSTNFWMNWVNDFLNEVLVILNDIVKLRNLGYH